MQEYWKLLESGIVVAEITLILRCNYKSLKKFRGKSGKLRQINQNRLLCNGSRQLRCDARAKNCKTDLNHKTIFDSNPCQNIAEILENGYKEYSFVFYPSFAISNISNACE